jgi:hypothetical protein
MAKRSVKSTAAAATAKAADTGWIVCTGYTLTIKRKPGCVFQLDVNDDTYHFRVVDPDDRTGLVQKITRVLADRWPSPTFEFRANAAREIIEIR